MSEEKHGIKETKEALKGALKLTVFITKRLKDGADLQDAMALYTKWQSDPEFKKCLQDAYTDISKVGDEINDLSIAEAIELGSLLIEDVPALIDALKGEQASGDVA